MVLGLALVACSSSDALGTVILPDVGPTYQTASGTDAEMSLDTAAQATITPRRQTASALTGAGYRDGWSHVWTNPQKAQITILLFEFDGNTGPASFMRFVQGYLGSQPSAYVSSDAAISGGVDYVLNGTLVNGGNVFCQGVFFAVAQRAFEVRTCAPTPGDITLAHRLAVQQRDRARPVP